VDSKPSIGGFMIFLYVVLVGLAGVGFTIYSINREVKCKHTHFAEYRGSKKKQCIDCGLEVSIDATNW
jgi:hypothetical protein